MNLPTRPLGSSGIEITTVGFGAWAAGGGGWSFGWGPQDDEESIAAMRRAIDGGVNWIDTAAVYGLGHSEEVVGRLLRSSPRPTGRWSSRNVDWSGTTPTGWRWRCATCSRRPSHENARRRCGGCRWSASTCTSSTGRTRPARRSKTHGPRWCVSWSRARCARSGVSNFACADAREVRGGPARGLAAAAVLARSNVTPPDRRSRGARHTRPA